MSETTTEHEAVEGPVVESAAEAVSDEQLIGMLVNRARSDGLHLTGEGGLLQQLTKRVLESALEGGITDHVGYDKHDAAGRNSGNSRNGTRSKTVLSDVGPVELKVPRDTAGTFEPQIVRKRQRRLTGVDRWCCPCPRRASRMGRYRLIWPRCTARRCPSRPSPRSPTK
ncbi:hypothetical protein JOF35_005179 [Streptomyces demainii]|uniref:Mutator family transposase n=1 Tax=Streptomyces demainii TaxID=588122 RepID=A0ABT9KWT3_9ACTN|nr:hypothetical protein [Streptomyces demainii]